MRALRTVTRTLLALALGVPALAAASALAVLAVLLLFAAVLCAVAVVALVAAAALGVAVPAAIFLLVALIFGKVAGDGGAASAPPAPLATRTVPRAVA